VSFLRYLFSYASRLLLLVVLAGIIVLWDYHFYPDVAFTPILCVIGLLVLALRAGPPTVCLAFSVFFVAMLVSLIQTTSFDPAQPAHVARVCLRMGGLTITGSLAVFMAVYRSRLQGQLKDSMELFQSLPLPIIVTNEQWVILDGNLEVARYLGADISALANKSYDAFFQILFTDQIEQEWFDKWAASSGINVFNAKLAVKKDGETTGNVGAVLYKLGFGKSARIITVLKSLH
jgi:PAS domain-containing protein